MAAGPIALILLLQAAVTSDVPPALPDAPALADPELEAIRGKFLLPNGVEVAMAVTSDTYVDGRAVLRTVFAVDNGAAVQVFGRTPGSPAGAAGAPVVRAAATPGMGVSVIFDRASHTQVVTPTFTGSPNVAVSTAPSGDAAALGLRALDVVPGGAPVATADGQVTLSQLARGSQVNFAGEGLAVTNLVGAAIATAVANSADNRAIDTVTNINIDLRNAAPYAIANAALRVEALALEATRGMMR